MATLSRTVKTEAKKRYSCGFALTESELRRLHEVLVQQIKRTPVGEGFFTAYELKYRNGSVASLATLDEVLSEENFGSVAILRFRMEVFDKEEKPSNHIGVQFSNVNEDEEGPYYYGFRPISYFVSGEDRDWVFLTSSQIDERFSKIKLFSPTRIFQHTRGFSASAFSMMLLFGAIIAIMLSVITRHDRYAVHRLDALEQSWRTGVLKDAAEVAIQVGRIELNRSDFSNAETIWGLVAILAVPLISLLCVNCYRYFQPPFNFLWGDYVAVYEKRRSRGRFLLGGVILTIVMGVLVNFISRRIGI